MSEIIALLYDAAARRSGWAGISGPLLNAARSELPQDALRAIDDFGSAFDAFLTSQPLIEVKNVGFIGVPTLTSEEVDSWISHFEFVQEPRRRGSSWDLWQTDNENYVLFPSDDDHPHALNVCAVVVTGSTVQLRTFVSGLAISRDEVIATAAPHIATQTCVYTDKVDDPGAPYRGSCVSDDDACPDGCSAQIALSPTTGRYSITDCKCEK